MLRFRSVIAVVVVAMVVASAAVAIAAAATFGGEADAARQATVPTPRATSPKARANRRAARLDAASLLTKLNLPAGATSVPSEPAHDNGYLAPLPLLESEFASATAHAWWTVPSDPQSVIAAIERDPPAGATQDGTGSGGNFKTGTSELDVDYQWPSLAGVLGARLLRVTVTSLGGGLTGVLAQSQSVWIVPRPASERIPAATRIVQINSAVPGAADGGSVTVTRSAQVGAIVALLNRLPIVQPGVTGCPGLMLPAKTITMTFGARAGARAGADAGPRARADAGPGAGPRARADAASGARVRARAGGAVLAVLRFVDYRPWKTAYSSQCEPVQLSIGGRRRAALDGGTFIERIERIIGLSIT
jgi:hypothetical protein